MSPRHHVQSYLCLRIACGCSDAFECICIITVAGYQHQMHMLVFLQIRQHFEHHIDSEHFVNVFPLSGSEIDTHLLYLPAMTIKFRSVAIECAHVHVACLTFHRNVGERADDLPQSMPICS